VRNYLVNKRNCRERYEDVRDNHIDKMKFIQSEWRRFKNRPKKMNIRRFKELLSAYLMGWRIRRILRYIDTTKEAKELKDTLAEFLSFDKSDHKSVLYR